MKIYLQMACLWATVTFWHIQYNAPVASASTQWCTLGNLAVDNEIRVNIHI